MNSHPRPSLFALGILLLTSTQLCANELENQIASSQEITSLYHKQPKKNVKSDQPYDYKPRSENGMIGNAEYLLWEAQQDGLEYAANVTSLGGTSTSATQTSSAVEEKVKFKDVHPEYSSGFRLGLGYLLCKKNDSWDVLVDWTWYQGRAHGETKVLDLSISTVAPLWGSQIFSNVSGTFQKASAHWNLHYQTVDLEIGRTIFAGKKVSIRPHFGLEWALIQQEYRVRYKAPESVGSELGSPSIAPFTTRFKGENDFDGIGLRFGADAKWYLSHHFGLCGEVAGALLWGRFHVHEKFLIPETMSANNTTNPTTGSVTAPRTLKVNEHLRRLRPNLQGSAGIFWQNPFHKGKRLLTVTLEYEFLAWFFQNHLFPNTGSGFKASNSTTNGGAFTIRDAVPDTRDGILGLQGLTASIGLEF